MVSGVRMSFPWIVPLRVDKLAGGPACSKKPSACECRARAWATWSCSINARIRDVASLLASINSRHSFCSHLAMRGAPAKAIQELAGHRDLSMTQRYMHLSPAAVEEATRLLEQPAPVSQFGDILETVAARE
jgi:hypothetical protein